MFLCTLTFYSSDSICIFLCWNFEWTENRRTYCYWDFFQITHSSIMIICTIFADCVQRKPCSSGHDLHHFKWCVLPGSCGFKYKVQRPHKKFCSITKITVLKKKSRREEKNIYQASMETELLKTFFFLKLISCFDILGQVNFLRS